MGIIIIGIRQADITLVGRRVVTAGFLLGSTHDNTSIAMSYF